MLGKSIVFAIIAACGVTTGAASDSTDPPEFKPPPEPPQEKDHYFCCDSVNHKGSGEGCAEILESAVIACGNVLYCDGGYSKSDDGKVTCQ